MASAEDQEMFDEIVENLQADLHIEMDRADTFEVTFDKVKRWLAAFQKQLDRPFISLNTIVMAAVDTAHVAVVEGISVLTSRINSDLSRYHLRSIKLILGRSEPPLQLIERSLRGVGPVDLDVQIGLHLLEHLKCEVIRDSSRCHSSSGR